MKIALASPRVAASVEECLKVIGHSITVGRRFGYWTQTSVTQLQAGAAVSAITIPANRVATSWQRYDRYQLHRHGGTGLEFVKNWEFGIDSFVTDQYPDD